MEIPRLLILFLTYFCTYNACITAKNVGEQCNPAALDPKLECAFSTSFLSCDISGRCLCKDGAMFDWTSGQCELLIRETCPDADNTPLTANTNCINGYVVCDNGYIEVPGVKKCALPYGRFCSPFPGFQDCNEDYYHECNAATTTCMCNENDAIYDAGTGKCVLKADKACAADEPYKIPAQECTSLSNCTDLGSGIRQCTCKNGLQANENGLCRVMHEDTCDNTPDLPCDESKFLSCINAKCSCKYGTVYELGVKLEKCQIQANRQCDPMSSQKCVTFSTCEKVEQNGVEYNFCMCRDDLITNSTGQCVLPYGAYCGATGDPLCNEAGYQTCTTTSPKKCTCKDNKSLYDAHTKSCSIVAGGPCTKDGTPCIANAECESGTCYCKADMRPNKEGICVLEYEKSCNANNDLCDPLSFLKCNSSSSSCDCASSNSVYDKDTKTCRLKVNSQCELFPYSQSCVNLAECVSGTCQCNSPYPGDRDLVSNQLGQCVRQYGSKCNLQDVVGDCDGDYGFQKCSQTNFCECSEPDNMDYNANDGRCYLTKGKDCTGGALCQEGLECAEDICKCDSSLGLVENLNGDCVRTPGSTCDNDHPLGRCDERAYMSCINKTCECNYGYVQVGAGVDAKCVGNFNVPCNTHENCNVNASLICNTNNKCDCASQEDQVYDLKTQHCWTVLYGRCHISRNEIGEGEVPLECNQESHLACRRVSENDIGNFGVCRCSTGYFDINGYCASTGGANSIFTHATILTVLMSTIVSLMLSNY